MAARQDEPHRRCPCQYDPNRLDEFSYTLALHKAPTEKDGRRNVIPAFSLAGDHDVLDAVPDHAHTGVHARTVLLQQFALALGEGDDTISATDHRFLPHPLGQTFWWPFSQ